MIHSPPPPAAPSQSAVATVSPQGREDATLAIVWRITLGSRAVCRVTETTGGGALLALWIAAARSQAKYAGREAELIAVIRRKYSVPASAVAVAVDTATVVAEAEVAATEGGSGAAGVVTAGDTPLQGTSQAVSGEQEVARWLEGLGLGCYMESLIDEGWDTLDTLALMTPTDADDCGMTPLHRKTLLAAVAALSCS